MEASEKEIFERLTAVEQSLKSIAERQEKSDEMLKRMYEMTVEMKNLREDVNKLVGQVEAIEEKPAKRWESIIAAVIGAVGGSIGTAVITFFIK